MPGPSEKTIKRLFAMSGNLCAFPGCQLPIVESAGTITGEICHIHAASRRGARFDASQTDAERHGYDNLLLLCRRHHKIVDDQYDVYSADALRHIKMIRAEQLGRTEEPADGFFAKILLADLHRQIEANNNSGNLAILSPGAIQAQTVNVRMARHSVKFRPPAGTIGADQDTARYIEYLIRRYNEYARTEPSRATKFSYGAISKNITDQFGSSWRLLPAATFAAVCLVCKDRPWLLILES
jgi:hypothetical protein